MAQKVIVLKTCDLPHDDDNFEARETIEFAFDGTSYQLDTCAEHSEQVQNQIQELISYARKTSERSRRTTIGTGPNRSKSEELAAIRSWARKKGYTVSDRGRISAEIREAYDKASKK